MKASKINPKPPFFDRYIKLVEDIDLIDALEKFSPENLFSNQVELEALGDQVYEPGKWTIKQIIQHCIDTERIMGYRALRFARNDQTELAGFEQDAYADVADVSERTLEDLLDEFDLVRASTLAQFYHWDEDTLKRMGTASNINISAGALGFVIVGHAIHHQNIMTSRYLPLFEK
ncbi:DinB family protein [Persicitalea jodogahamensis]|uniref:DNA damage-inducible protein DinB n=1 Tax=Persicitalea jodogahamensis TaxID=402147 RepID=A0A8J3D6G6_9BACT|nr:DinB family protein [Persicitalea jodogahamensis]GHB80806.1 DNA damage-inducible protein DinB [Persicitalea jodogahamensis]